MAKFARDYATLYQQEYPYPPVRLFTTHVDTFQINYYVPSEVEVEAAVRRLCPHKSGGRTHLRVEHFKALLREAYPVEGVTPPQPGRWMQIMDIVQYMWSTGDIPQELGWTTLVLIPK